VSIRSEVYLPCSRIARLVCNPADPQVFSAILIAQLKPAPGTTQLYQRRGRLFRSIIVHMPEFQNQLLRDVQQESFTQQVLALTDSPALRLRYKELLQDFFLFSTRKGWMKIKAS